jgi:hypothetical protein
MSTKNVTVTVASVVVAQAGFINWIQGSGTTYTVSVNAQTDYITVTDDVSASGGTAATTTFTPAGSVAAVNVQTAIEEVASEYATADSTHAAAADPHAGYLKEADIAAKGDLFVGTANDTVGIMTVDAVDNYTSLVPTSGVANGITWSIPRNPYAPTAAAYETFPRQFQGKNSAALSTGRLSLVPIALPTGLTLTSITFLSGTTAFAAGSANHQIFGLYNSSRVLLRGTSDDTTTAWAADSIKTLSLTSQFVTTYSGFYYLGILVALGAGGTMPSVVVEDQNGTTALPTLAPILGGTSNTGLTALPDPANAPAAGGNFIYGYVS